MARISKAACNGRRSGDGQLGAQLTRLEDPDAEKTLTIHIRADDIQKYPEGLPSVCCGPVLDFPFPWYREPGACKDYSWGQPPCSMYEKIIRESGDFTKLLLIQKGLLGRSESFQL